MAQRTHCKNGHEYTAENTFSGGRNRKCKQCGRERMAAWRAANPERAKLVDARATINYRHRNPDQQRETQLKTKYGLTIAAFDALLASQDGACKVCRVKLDVYKKGKGMSPHNSCNTAHIDHCHETGVVRGILCLRCNAAVGYVKDCPRRAWALAVYLEASRAQSPRDRDTPVAECVRSWPVTAPFPTTFCHQEEQLQLFDERLKPLFWRHVQPEPNSGCWFWLGYEMPNGYGRCSYKSRPHLVHRVTYMALVGPIPDRLVIDHKCRNRLCCNPAHLEVVNQSTNTKRGDTGMAARTKRCNQCRPAQPLLGIQFRRCATCTDHARRYVKAS